VTAIPGTPICVRCDRPISEGGAVTLETPAAASGARPDMHVHADPLRCPASPASRWSRAPGPKNRR
jgi:hypothetical protein